MSNNAESYAQAIEALRQEGAAMVREGTRRLRLADELEKTVAPVEARRAASPVDGAVAVGSEVSLEQLKEFIAQGGTGRAEHIAAKLGTTPERIKELVAQNGSGLTARDRGWVKLENQLLL